MNWRILFLSFKAIFGFEQHTNWAESERRETVTSPCPTALHLFIPFQAHFWAFAQTVPSTWKALSSLLYCANSLSSFKNSIIHLSGKALGPPPGAVARCSSILLQYFAHASISACHSPCSGYSHSTWVSPYPLPASSLHFIPAMSMGMGNNLLGSSRAPHVSLGNLADSKKGSKMTPSMSNTRRTRVWMLGWKFKKGINAEDQPGYRQKGKTLTDKLSGRPKRWRTKQEEGWKLISADYLPHSRHHTNGPVSVSHQIFPDGLLCAR